MLGPMPLACNLGVTPLAFETIVPFSLGLGGNCVTISNAVWGRMAAHGAETDLDPARVGLALGAFIHERAVGRDPLRFAVVRIRKREIVIVPPPFMADALARDRIEDCCVGESWNTPRSQPAPATSSSSRRCCGGTARRR
jgi:two-component system, oxyanion-binding sensor